MKNRDKQMIVDTIIKLVNSSPSKKFDFYSGSSIKLKINQQEFNIWVDYVKSNLDILSEYAMTAVFSSAKMQVLYIASQENLSYMQRVLDIERYLLDLAQSILRYY